MSTETESARPADPGLEALVTLLHLQGVAADAGQIRHRLGTDKIGAPEMLRCARDLGLKARAYRTDWSRLASTPLPAIASLRDGGFLLVAKADGNKVLVQSPLAPRPALMTREELLAVWDGRLILMTRRAGLSDVTRRFDITVLSTAHPYRTPGSTIHCSHRIELKGESLRNVSGLCHPKLDQRQQEMRPIQPSVVDAQRHVMLSAVPSSGIVYSVIRITGIGDRDRPEWLIRINGIRTIYGTFAAKASRTSTMWRGRFYRHMTSADAHCRRSWSEAGCHGAQQRQTPAMRSLRSRQVTLGRRPAVIQFHVLIDPGLSLGFGLKIKHGLAPTTRMS